MPNIEKEVLSSEDNNIILLYKKSAIAEFKKEVVSVEPSLPRLERIFDIFKIEEKLGPDFFQSTKEKLIKQIVDQLIEKQKNKMAVGR